jgi:hypothetical protein
MTRIIDWNIDDVIDGHQAQKTKRVRAVAKVLERKGRVNYKQFLAEMQYNGLRKSVAEEYLDTLKDLRMVRIDKDDIVWNGTQNDKND